MGIVRRTALPEGLPGLRMPATGLEAPFDMLAACHERVERVLALLAQLRTYLAGQGRDESGRQAARDVMRYFDLAALLHHEDEELHIFPPLKILITQQATWPRDSPTGSLVQGGR